MNNQPSPAPISRAGIFLVLFAAAGFAGKTILAKLAFRYGVDPLTLLTLRMLIAGVFFAAVLGINVHRGRWQLKLTRKQWILITLMGIGGYYLSSYLDFAGLYYVDANLGRMILFLYPTMVVILNSFISRTKFSSSAKISLTICYLGLFLMMSPNLGRPQRDFLLGSSLILCSALTYAVYLVGVDHFFKDQGINFFVSLIFGVSSAAVFIHFSLLRPLASLRQPSEVYWLVLLMALVSTVLPIYALSAGLAKIGAPRAATLSMAGPIATLFMGIYILDEKVAGIQILGMFLMILGVSRIK
ncbi:MAG: DMT family transporter [Deltaproteobacteria bacterium]|jgi:drug/metabolite transporter (DMT)-like permease|nr:DMT family transporter [Deltaproteobacteria bacterium]